MANILEESVETFKNNLFCPRKYTTLKKYHYNPGRNLEAGSEKSWTGKLLEKPTCAFAKKIYRCFPQKKNIWIITNEFSGIL